MLHTGVNEHNEPVNCVPKIGWASSILPTKLGGANPRSMGTADRGWLPPRVDRGSSTEQSASPNKMFTRGQEPDNLRGSGALVQRGSGGDTSLTKEFCVPDLPGGKEGWGSETSDKLEGSQPICEGRTLQDGRSSLAPRPPTVTGLDGKDGFEGCLPSSAHPSRLSTPSHLPMGGENLQVSMPTFWPISSTQSVYKAVEASSGLPETEWVSSDHLSRRSADDASGQSSAGANYPTDLSTVREPGVNGESEKIHTDPYSGVGFQLCSTTMRISLPSEKLRKIHQDARRMMQQASVSVREIARFVGKTTATMRAIPLAPLHYRALQTQMNSVLPLNYSQEEISNKYNTVLSLTSASKEDLQWWLTNTTAPMGAPVCPSEPSITVHSNASNQGWGAVLKGQSQTGGVWSPEEATHHVNYLELLAAFLAIKALGRLGRTSQSCCAWTMSQQ